MSDRALSSVRFVLASASPARLKTLRAAGVEPEVIVSGVDESGVTAPTTADLVLELARRKARAVADILAADADADADADALVFGCDSLLDLDGVSLGKPVDATDARERWTAMRGRTGVLHTGHVLLGPAGERAETASTTVRFADVTDEEIDRYVATGEPLAVAGAFTLDGLGGWFVETVDGDPHTVVGLSLPLLRRMLAELGLQLADIGYPADR